VREKVRVLIIEDQADLAAYAQREIEDAFESSEEIEVEVFVETDFDEGLARVRHGDSDVVVLDVRRDTPDASSAEETAGHAVFLDIKDACFAPVVFWTALPEKVTHEQMIPLVTVVTKEETDQLPVAIQAAVASRAVVTISGIEQYVATVLRKHMWNELAPHWAEYTEGAQAADIAPVLLTRLARVLEEDREGSLTARPSHRYVYPPISDNRAPGDILRASDQTWWVTLTPACDFAQDKVGFALLAHATPLEEHPKYGDWKNEYTADKNKDKAEQKRGKGEWNTLRQDVLASTRGRYHYLPRFRDIPDLVIDLEDVRAEAGSSLSDFSPIASLASPFAEALLIQHSQYRGRIGVPDLDAEIIRRRLVDGFAEGAS
jgi:CheY-like chemotaxis protein